MISPLNIKIDFPIINNYQMIMEHKIIAIKL